MQLLLVSMYFNLAHMVRGSCTDCVCVCVSVTSPASAVSPLKAKVRYKRKGDIRKEQNH